MEEIIEAIYEDGVLKPLKKLNLKEGERVKLEIKKNLVERIKKYRMKVDEDLLEEFLKERR